MKTKEKKQSNVAPGWNYMLMCLPSGKISKDSREAISMIIVKILARENSVYAEQI